jgi:hypothetical protein
VIGDEQRIDWNDGNEDGQIKMAFKQRLRKTPHLLTRWYNVWGVHRNASQGDHVIWKLLESLSSPYTAH